MRVANCFAQMPQMPSAAFSNCWARKGVIIRPAAAILNVSAEGAARKVARNPRSLRKKAATTVKKPIHSIELMRLAQEMGMALRLARSIREGQKVGGLIVRRLKVKGMSIQLPYLANEAEGLSNGGGEYASPLSFAQQQHVLTNSKFGSNRRVGPNKAHVHLRPAGRLAHPLLMSELIATRLLICSLCSPTQMN